MGLGLEHIRQLIGHRVADPIGLTLTLTPLGRWPAWWFVGSPVRAWPESVTWDWVSHDVIISQEIVVLGLLKQKGIVLSI